MVDAQGRPVVIIHLQRFFDSDLHPELKGLDLWEEIKSGRNKSEWREGSPYWLNRLFSGKWRFSKLTPKPILRAWFVIGYPRGNIPRLEATVTDVVYWGDSDQIETRFKDVIEVSLNRIPIVFGIDEGGQDDLNHEEALL